MHRTEEGEKVRNELQRRWEPCICSAYRHHEVCRDGPMVAHRDTWAVTVCQLFNGRGFRVHVEYPICPRRLPPVAGVVRRAVQ